MIIVCSLKDLNTVCESVNPSHVISVIDPGYAPETPPGVSNHLKLGFDDIIEVNPKNQIFKNSYKWIYEIRRLILFAFFRSEYGAKKVLRYDPIPGNYVGEVKLEPEDKSWAT